MSLHRRDLLKAGIVASVAIGAPGGASAQTVFAPRPGEWRSFAVTSRIEIARPNGRTQAWVPLPSINESDWFRSLGSEWTGNGASTVLQEPTYGAQMLQVAWADGIDSCIVEVTSRIATRDRAVDLAKPGTPSPLSTAQRELYTRGTDFIPVDGIVKETSDKIVGSAKTDVDKARAIYEWVVDHTFRAAEVRGCGVGDIVAMLRSGNLGGKCADINALYVGLARAAGLPARDIYGVRVPRRASATRALAQTPQASAKRSIAGQKSISPVSVGSLSTPPTCARSYSKNRRRTVHSTMRRSLPPAARYLARGREIGWHITSLTTWLCPDRPARNSLS